MAFTYPIAFPTNLTVNDFEIEAVTAQAENISPFTLEEQVYDFGGQRWVISGKLPLMEKANAAAYSSFMLRLNGRVGTFLFPIPNSAPRGVATGTPLVNGGGQTGMELDIDGLTSNTTGIFLEGDMINLGTGGTTTLHQIIEDADSNSSGETTLKLWPEITTAPADNEAVVVNNVKLHCRMTRDFKMNLNVDKHYIISFEARGT